MPLGEISKSLCINITQSTNDTQCLFSPRTYFVYGTAAYTCLPPSWKGIGTKALLTPQIDVVPDNQGLPIPVVIYTQTKRAIQIIPLLIAIGITVGIGISIGGTSLSVYTYQKLSTECNNDIEQVSQSLEALQDQVDSLVSVVLQNRHALDLLTAEKGGTCLFLNKECCLYTNKSGVVRDMACQLRECITKTRQELANVWSFWNHIWSWAPWALPLAGPLFMLLLILLFRPCIINALSRFIYQQVQKIKFQCLVKEYSPLPTHEPSI
jgi:hypothetical protein